jgi:hypothetical protein
VPGRILFKVLCVFKAARNGPPHAVAEGQRTAAAKARSCGGTLNAPRRHSWKGRRSRACRRPSEALVGVGDLAGGRPARPGRRGGRGSWPSDARVGGASVPDRSSKLKGATRRKRRPQPGRPLTFEPLRPSGRRQAGGLPSQGVRRQPQHRLVSAPPWVCQGRLDAPRI